MEDAVVPVMVVLIGALLVSYVLFVRWRIRVHAERKTASGVSAPPARSTAASVAPPLASPTLDVDGSGDPAADTESQDPSHRTVAGALEGVTLPDALVPLVHVTPRHAADRVVFSAPGGDPSTLRDGLGDALTGVGYRVEWLGSDAHARKDGVVLRVSVFADGATATIDGTRAFPTVAAGVPVVDIWF